MPRQPRSNEPTARPAPSTPSRDEHRPLAGYAVLSGVFGAAMAGGLVAARRSGRDLPERFPVQDVLMAGIATQRLSRLIAKDKDTSTVRAPVTRFQQKSGRGEVEEAPRGRGPLHVTGELLVCPYCVAQWVAGGFTLGYDFAPRVTRLLAAMWTVHAVADIAQLGYAAAEDCA